MAQWKDPWKDPCGWQGASGRRGSTFPGSAAGASAPAPGGWWGAWGGDAFGADGFGCNGSAGAAWGGGCGDGARGTFGGGGDGSGGGGGGNGPDQPSCKPPRTTAVYLGASCKASPPMPPAEQGAAEEPRAATRQPGSERPPATHLGASFKSAPPRPPTEQRAAEQCSIVEPRAAKCQQGSEKPPAGVPKRPLAFAMMPTVNGPVYAPTSNVDFMLRADYALFCELLFDDIAGHPLGSVAYGVEEVAEAVEQDAVAALFCPVSLGTCGEAACRKVVASGGRAYMIGPQHELYKDVEMWAGTAVLKTQLQVPGDAGKGQEGGAAAADKPMPDGPEAPPREPAGLSELKLVLRSLGKLASLNDQGAIPACAVAVKDRFIPDLGPDLVLAAFAEAFDGAKGVAHRKAIVNVAHELAHHLRACLELH